ncbi:hypothetical protein RAD15_29235 [Bradyrhizobium sp. 14AA]
MTARSPEYGVPVLEVQVLEVQVLGFAMRNAARKRSATTTGAGGRRETAPRHAFVHVVLIALVIGSHIAASSSRSGFDASNIERLARLVNEMAIHICGPRAGAFLPAQARTVGFISR